MISVLTTIADVAQVPDGFVSLNTRNNLQLIDGIVANLSGISPILGAWNMDGTLASPIDLTKWLNVAPDVNGARPTAYVQLHGWEGWNQQQTT